MPMKKFPKLELQTSCPSFPPPTQLLGMSPHDCLLPYLHGIEHLPNYVLTLITEHLPWCAASGQIPDP